MINWCDNCGAMIGAKVFADGYTRWMHATELADRDHLARVRGRNEVPAPVAPSRGWAACGA